MFRFALCEGIEPAQERWEEIGGTGDDDMLKGSIRANSSHDRIEHIEHYDDARARISQLMLHLALSIQWISGHNDRAGPQRAIECDGILRNVRKRDCHTVAFLDTQTLQAGGKAIRQRGKQGVADLCAIVDKSGMAWMLADRLIQQPGQRAVRNIEFGRNALLIVA